MSLFREEDSVGSERGVIAIVTELTDGEQGVVGHAWKNVGTTSNSGKRRKYAVVGKQCCVGCGHGVAIGKANSVGGGNRTLVDTWGVGSNEVF